MRGGREESENETGRWTVGRRELFGLTGAGALALVLAACGKSGSPPVAAVSSTATTGSATASTAGSATATSPAAIASSSSTTAGPSVEPTPTAHIGGAHVASGAITVSNAEREETVANGTWLGAWHDSAGNSGTSDVTIAINGRALTARASVAFTGPLLGAGTTVPAQVYEVDLASYVLLADSWTVDSPQFGTVTVVPGGDIEGSGSAKHVPGHPEISAITIEATKTGRRVDLNYTITRTGGATVKGTMAWALGATRATPKALTA